jgi:hypothetical protein
VARAGPQIEFVTKEFTNSIPSRASLSRFGVGGSFTPYLSDCRYAEIACAA